jgi:uncharacterized protein YecE (DUF72 family)
VKSRSGSECEIRIGTSGWHYKHWLGTFYPPSVRQSNMLEYYVSRFDTVELNNTFYRLPSEDAIDAWRHAVPGNFLFAVKASRFLTHRIKLKDPMRALAKFMPVIERFGRKLGPILFQLPPQWQVNMERLADLLALLPPRRRYAFEFRNRTWNTAEIHDLLRRFNAASCFYELAGYSSPQEFTADFAYIRLHGPGGKYQGSYSAKQLEQWANRIRKWSERLKAIYVYFDNDQAGYAANNAVKLRKMVHSPGRLSAVDQRPRKTKPHREIAA